MTANPVYLIRQYVSTVLFENIEFSKRTQKTKENNREISLARKKPNRIKECTVFKRSFVRKQKKINTISARINSHRQAHLLILYIVYEILIAKPYRKK